MQWLPYLAFSLPAWTAAAGGDISPVSGAAGDIVTYVLGYGVLGVAAVLFTLRIIVPRSAVDDAKAQARTDLLDENRRLIAEKDAAFRQRDESLKFAQDQLVPLLVTFNASVASLLPILQTLVTSREDDPPHRRDGGRRDERR